MSVTAPFAASLADRLPRQRVMIGADLLRFVVVIAAVACLWLGTPAAPIFILATIVSVLGSVFRPAQMAWVPALADSPEELTASNGASSTIESLAFFVGPALGGALIALTNVEIVFLLNAVTFLWSAALVAAIRPKAPAQSEVVAEDDVSGAPEEKEGLLEEMFAGFSQIWHDKDLLLVAFLVCAQTVVAGASTVFAVLFAVDILETGPEGVGLVDSVFGVGAIVGGFYAIARASRNKLAGDMSLGTFLWSIPLLLIVFWPTPASVFAAVVVLGFANPLVDVNFATIVQRIVPERVLGRVFGAFEGALIGTMALGAAAMPFLVQSLGLRGALVVLAVGVGAPVIPLVPKIRQLDRKLRAPEALPLLRSIPVFAPLAPSTLEALARQLVRVPISAGTVVLREGDASDKFYVIESGAVEVTQSDRFLRREGPGDFFGEIGLLRDVPRTATITAVEDTVLYSLARPEFLEAVTGNTESRIAIEDVASRRLMF